MTEGLFKPMLLRTLAELARSGVTGLNLPRMVERIWGYRFDPELHPPMVYKAIQRLRKEFTRAFPGQEIIRTLRDVSTGFRPQPVPVHETPFLELEACVTAQRRRTQVSPGDLVLDGLFADALVLVVVAVTGLDARLPLVLLLADLYLRVFPRARRQALVSFADLVVYLGAPDSGLPDDTPG